MVLPGFERVQEIFVRNSTALKTERNASIELLKIFALALIVVGHVVQTIGSTFSYVPFSDYYVNLREVTDQFRFLALSMLRYCGNLGNTVFFICSAWFFLDNNTVNKKKIFMLLMDIWTVSVLILAAVLIIGHRTVVKSLVLMSLFPTTFENNWYLSCYLIFYAIHPLLNQIIDRCGQKALFRLNAAAIVLYFIIGFATCLTRYLFAEGTTFFSSRLILWTVIYFVIAYLKRYGNERWSDSKFNAALVVIGFIGYFGLVCVMNLIGSRNGRFYDSLQIWRVDNNPFMVLLALGLFGFAKNREFRSRQINYVAKLAPFIYIIHENRILRGIYRPEMWQYVYTRFGYDHVIGWVLILALLVFAFGFLCSVLYYEGVRRLTVPVYSGLYSALAGKWIAFENRILKTKPERETSGK